MTSDQTEELTKPDDDIEPSQPDETQDVEELRSRLEQLKRREAAFFQAEAGLREREQFIRRVVETAPSIIYIYDIAHNRNVFANTGLSRILGYSKEEIQSYGSDLFMRLVHPDDLEKIKAHYLRVAEAADGEILSQVYRLKDREGGWRYLRSWDVVFLRDDEGRATQITGAAIDITEQCEAEVLAHESQDRLLAFMASATDGFMIFDADLVLIEANRPGWKPWVDDRDEVVGKHILEFMPELHEKGLFHRYLEVLENGAPFGHDLMFSTPVDEDFYLDVRVFKVGEGLGLIVTDITALKEAERELLAHRNHLEEMVEDRTAELEEALDTVFQQSRDISELSTPVHEVWEGILVMTLVGQLDARRMNQAIDRLLFAVAHAQARIVLIDISGVPTIDSEIAAMLVKARTAVGLLGTSTVLTGVRPTTAHTLVKLGEDLTGLAARPSLAGGIRLAFEQLGLAVGKAPRT